MKRTRRSHGATFKAHVAVEALKDDKSLTQLAEAICFYPIPITEWEHVRHTHLSARN